MRIGVELIGELEAGFKGSAFEFAAGIAQLLRTAFGEGCFRGESCSSQRIGGRTDGDRVDVHLHLLVESSRKPWPDDSPYRLHPKCQSLATDY